MASPCKQQSSLLVFLFIADEVENVQKKLKFYLNEIECFSKLMTLLLSMKFGLTAQERSILQSHLCPDLKDGIEQGWEETVNSSILYLLKTTLSKNGKESASLNASIPDAEVSSFTLYIPPFAQLTSSSHQMPKSIDSLRKNFLQLVDRLEKGGRLLSASNSSAGSSVKPVR